jgi:hypothetical protein
MAAMKMTITREESEVLETLVRVARWHNDRMRDRTEEICKMLGPESCDFVEDVVRRGESLAWMLERLGVEVEG